MKCSSKFGSRRIRPRCRRIRRNRNERPSFRRAQKPALLLRRDACSRPCCLCSRDRESRPFQFRIRGSDECQPVVCLHCRRPSEFPATRSPSDSFPVAQAAFWPVASCITASCVASAAGSSPATRPSCITRIRSLIPSTSGNSEEIITTATPLATSSFSKW